LFDLVMQWEESQLEHAQRTLHNKPGVSVHGSTPVTRTDNEGDSPDLDIHKAHTHTSYILHGYTHNVDLTFAIDRPPNTDQTE